MEENLNKLMSMLDIDRAAALNLVTLFEEEGFTSLEEGVAWTNEVLSSLAQPQLEESRFDKRVLIPSDNEGDGGSKGFHPIFQTNGGWGGFTD